MDIGVINLSLKHFKAQSHSNTYTHTNTSMANTIFYYQNFQFCIMHEIVCLCVLNSIFITRCEFDFWTCVLHFIRNNFLGLKITFPISVLFVFTSIFLCVWNVHAYYVVFNQGIFRIYTNMITYPLCLRGVSHFTPWSSLTSILYDQILVWFMSMCAFIC